MEKSVRTIDNLGRIVIPKDIRKALDLNEFDEISISLSGSRIILEKENKTCVFCGNSKNISEFSGKYICEKCKNALSEK